MSNSQLVTYTKLSPHTNGKRTLPIERITPHCVVGQCSIEALGAEFAKPSKRASSNYGIDKDGRVGMFVPEDSRSICSSSSDNDNRAVTIECASDTTAPWAFRPAVYEALVRLCIDICKRNGKTSLLWIAEKDDALRYVPAQNEMLLTVHRWFANKACPGDWLMERMGKMAEQVNAAIKPRPWYADAMDWAAENGLINDGRPNDPVTRAEMATILRRYDKLVNEKILLHLPEDAYSIGTKG